MKKILIVIITIFSTLNFSACIRSNLEESSSTALSIGVFGGSVSSHPGSEIVFGSWEREFNVKVKSNGIGGMGFSTWTGDNNICNQINRADTFDVYILWASTNDVVKASVGNLDSDDPTTQNGGIRRAVKLIKEKNDTALIIFFTSLPRFDEVYDILPKFVEGQKAVCEDLNIPYLEQGKYIDINYDNYKRYYSDFAHPNNYGYQALSEIQMPFLRNYLSKKK